jgi:methylated-DNA-[protein]-cysteine S-methyltransferase
MTGKDIEALLRASAPVAGPPPALDLSRASPGLVEVAYALHDSPVGTLLLALTPRGLVRVAYLDSGDEQPALAELAARVSPRVLRAPQRLDAPRRELEDFFAGRRARFEQPLDLRLAREGFGRRVLRATAAIPYGAVSTYKAIAAAAGSPNAYRAAGSALGGNPLPIVIPCHRVLHSGGGLGGYTGGLARKRTLLAAEGIEMGR